MLKQQLWYGLSYVGQAAAFRRLCVETDSKLSSVIDSNAAAFRRLCVETDYSGSPAGSMAQPPSGGCVLKRVKQCLAVGYGEQPPSGGCVLKPI